MTDLTRRRLLQAAALLPLATACGARAWGTDASTAQASFALDMSRPERRVDPSLASLSYETLELSDPTFFAADNHGLVRLFREMNPHGVLRIGGNTSDDTVWGGYKGRMPTYVPRRHGKLLQPHVLQPEGLQALAGFVRATGWKLVFGVNLRIGSPEMAVDLAQTVQRLVGDQLLAIQIGNEANNYERDYAEFDAAWTPYARALHAAGLPIAGPDTGANGEQGGGTTGPHTPGPAGGDRFHNTAIGSQVGFQADTVTVHTGPDGVTHLDITGQHGDTTAADPDEFRAMAAELRAMGEQIRAAAEHAAAGTSGSTVTTNPDGSVTVHNIATGQSLGMQVGAIYTDTHRHHGR